jgi:thiol-disulfide isomerase/thioredoxin
MNNHREQNSLAPLQLVAQVLVDDQGLVCIYFTASWCGPCKKMAPIVDALSLKHKDVKFVKVAAFLFCKT